ncbi:MAG: family 10 glycosylhydrolase [Oscillospiraceae bacterium]
MIINLITNGVAELCENYDISGIHFDDYFYPTTDNNFDKTDYENYKNNNGQLKLEDWRRDNVTKLIKSVYDKIKAINKNISFGISPSGDYEKAQNSMYADLNKWLSQDGYVDYICPQIYYGFNNQSLPFEQTKNMWVDKTKAESVKLIVGLPFYKSGGEDLWAGSGKNEFKENSNIITKMIESIKKNEKISGYILYDYNHIKNLNTISSKEFEGLKQLNKK